MKNLNDYINSGILEMYVLGLTSPEENIGIENMASSYPEIADEIEAISKALLVYSEAVAPTLDVTLKPLIIATFDYMERLKNGEEPIKTPVLNENTKVIDFLPWLNRKDMVMSDKLDDFYVKLIGYEPEIDMRTAIVWIKDATPYEVHKDLHEKFFIIEGTCDIITDEGTHHLKPGDYYSLPLNLGHVVKVTSKTPCKVILQRVAA